MKLYDRYAAKSVVSIALLAVLLCTLMLVSVDLFSHLDSYLTNKVDAFTIARLTVLGVPEAVLFVLGPSLLFAATFYLSQMQANNEFICLLGSGLSYRRLVTPLLVVGLLLSFAQFGFSEQVYIPAYRLKNSAEDQMFGMHGTYDSNNITLTDEQGKYVVHAKQYNDKLKRLAQVMLVLTDDTGALQQRIDASWAFWEEDSGRWRLENVRIEQVNGMSMQVNSIGEETYYVPRFTLAPSYFRNLSNDIKTMDIITASQYLKRIAIVDPHRYPALATDFSKRILDCLNPLVMLFIACTISYKYKKNILLLSIITSLGIAVIYYVVQMLTLIMAKQGVIGPIWGMAIPMIVIVCIALAERIAIR
jgi:lipopolysaccharide export system permease protein